MPHGGLLTVLPVIRDDTGRRCIESLLDPERSSGLTADEVLVVDNTQYGFSDHRCRIHRDPNGHNLGVARAWNVAIREVLNSKLDYVVLLSASVEFGPILHCTWKSQMEAHWGSHLIEAKGHSWHLIAIHRRVFETIGLFDENFYPAYFEAIDFGYRMRTCGVVPWYGDATHNPELGLEQNYESVWVNAMSWGAAQHMVVDMPAGPLLEYYETKWGGAKGEETWTKPWGRHPIDYFPERSIPDLAKQYELAHWW